MAKVVMVQTVRGIPAIRAKVKLRQSIRPKVKAKPKESADANNGKDKA